MFYPLFYCWGKKKRGGKKIKICKEQPTLSTHTEQLGVLGVWMKALLFTSGDLKHASIGEPEDASAKFQGEIKVHH